MVDTQRVQRAAGVAGGTATLIALCCAAIAPGTTMFEGTKNRPYYDPAHILTVCNGETQDIEMRYYSTAECSSMLRKKLAAQYAPAILKCVPQFRNNRQAFTYSIDASYNAGSGAFCQSRAAAYFRQNRWSQGCNALRGWRVTATDRRTGQHIQLPGLARRRNWEADNCLKGAA